MQWRRNRMAVRVLLQLDLNYGSFPVVKNWKT